MMEIRCDHQYAASMIGSWQTYKKRERKTRGPCMYVPCVSLCVSPCGTAWRFLSARRTSPDVALWFEASRTMSQWGVIWYTPCGHGTFIESSLHQTFNLLEKEWQEFRLKVLNLGLTQALLSLLHSTVCLVYVVLCTHASSCPGKDGFSFCIFNHLSIWALKYLCGWTLHCTWAHMYVCGLLNVQENLLSIHSPVSWFLRDAF